MRFVVAVWNKIGDWQKFESEIPLLFNGKRRRSLGINEPVELLFLNGYEALSEDYISRLVEYGYRIHDVQKQTEYYAAKYSNLVGAYKEWYRIQFYGLLRFLIIGDLFKGESVCTYDSDMVYNASFKEIENNCKGKTFQLAQSSCFVSISDDAWFDEYRSNLDKMNEAPLDFAERYFGYKAPQDYFNPLISGGTDQAFLAHLARNGMIRNDEFPFYSHYNDLVWFPNWLHLGTAKDSVPWTYRRQDGIDYLNDKKVAISHMSNDTCSHFGSFILLKHILGIEKIHRLPVPFFGMTNEHSTKEYETMYFYFRSVFER